MNNAVFKDGQYWLGDKQLIRTTTLLSKHGLTKDLSHIPQHILDAKAERGTQIHNEIKNYIETGVVEFACQEILDFIDFCKELGLTDLQPETVVNNDIAGGTIDLKAKRGDKRVIIDYKTGLEVDVEGARWQLSLYEAEDGELFDELWIFHLCDNSKKFQVERIDPAETSKLFECERNGELYQKKGLVVSSNILEAVEAAEAELAKVTAAKSIAEEVLEKYKQILYSAMEEQQIKSWETPSGRLLITRVDPTTKTSIDSKMLKTKYPDIATECSSTSTVKGYVRITPRKE